MRSLECDFSPHLYPDPHPIWAEKWEAQTPGSTDVYASTPWWTSTALFPYDNAYLYYNPPPGYPAHNFNFTTQAFLVSFTQVLAGIVNPPGSALTGGTNNYLHPHFSTSTLGPWTPCTASPALTYKVGANGLGSIDVGCADVIPVGPPNEQWQGQRYNGQVINGASGAPDFNLQTFLAINGILVGPEGTDTDADARAATEHQPVVEGAATRLRRQ